MENEKNTLYKVIIAVMSAVIIILVGAFCYMYYDQTKVEDTTNTNKEDNSIQDKEELKELSYEIKKEGYCQRLYINGKKTERLGLINKVDKINNALVLSYVEETEEICNEHELSVIDYGITAVDQDGNIIAEFAGKNRLLTMDNVVWLSGGFERSYKVENNKIVISSDNGVQDPEYVAMNMDEETKLLPFQFIEEFEYKNGSFVRKTLKTYSANEYLENLKANKN